MRLTALALFSAGLLLGQSNNTPAQQPARRQVDWVNLGYYKQITPERWKVTRGSRCSRGTPRTLPSRKR